MLNSMKEIDDLQFLAEQILEISIGMQGRDTTWRSEQASLVFAKIGATALTLLKNIPGSPYFTPVGKFALWDLSAVVSLCRTHIETYYVLCYLRHEPGDPLQREFQQLLWEYHEEFERFEMMAATIPDAKSLPSIKEELAARRVRLETSSIFQSLKLGHRRELVEEGKKFKLESAIELSRRAGISENYYRGQYKYCSTYTHCAPFSISQLGAFRADSHDATELFNMPVRLAVAYSALAIRDFLAIFPEAEKLVAVRTRNLIVFWTDIVKWEKLPAFSNTANIVANDPEGSGS